MMNFPRPITRGLLVLVASFLIVSCSVADELEELLQTYKWLHAHPELS